MMMILRKWLDNFIWPINETITDSTTPVQSQPESNGNEKILHIPQSSSIEDLPSGEV